VVVQAGSLLVGATLLWASLSKARHLDVFAEQIADYRLVPYRLVRLVAVAIVAAEALAALLMVPAGTRRAALVLAVILLLAFTSAQLHAFLTGRRIACACFNATDPLETIGAHSIVRTVVLLALAATAALSGGAGFSAHVVLVALLLGTLVALVAETVRLLVDLAPITRALAASVQPVGGSAEGASG
jgi:hypothetical protein